MKGLFITFEGSEGSGKSTHIKLLAAYLKKKGFKVACVREPGNTKIGEKIRRILLDPENKEMSAYAEMLLYMACRSQLVDEIILPSLRRGTVVLSDRFLDSTLVYQGFGMGLNQDLIKRLGRYVCKGIKPDLTIFLDLDAKKGLSRAGETKDRIEQRPVSFHEKVRRGYLRLAALEPRRIKVIKVDDDKNKTQKKIRQLTATFLDSKPYGV